MIAFNGTSTFSGHGVWVENGTGSAIRANSIHDNLALGIAFQTGGSATPNDPGDGDIGPNGLQNFPVLSTLTPAFPETPEAGLHIQGTLHSTPSTTFDLDFFSNPACVRFPKDFLEGARYLGSGVVTTDGAGTGIVDVTVPIGIAAGEHVSATATSPSGSTSEFSQRLPFSLNTGSGDAAGGGAITVFGTDFEDGATVTIGGTPATGIVVVSTTSITAVTPALAAGSANDLVVTNTDATTGTLVKGWVADFLDVPGGQQFHQFVTTLVSSGITAGVGGGLYGVGDDTLRQQMAVFLLKAAHGLCYTPPPCTTQVFTDVPCSSNFAPWINELVTEGITGGCGAGVFCPQNPVRRDQMAVFLLKAEHGLGYTPPACVGTFPGRAVLVELRAVDRAARGGEHHRRLRRRQLLPRPLRQPRPDGHVRGQDVPAAVTKPTRSPHLGFVENNPGSRQRWFDGGPASLVGPSSRRSASLTMKVGPTRVDSGPVPRRLA